MRVVAAAIDAIGGAMNSIGGAMGFIGGAMNSISGAMGFIGGAMNSISGARGFIGGALSTIADLSKLHKKTPVHIDFVRELFLFYNSKNVIVSQSHFLFPNLQIQYRNINI